MRFAAMTAAALALLVPVAPAPATAQSREQGRFGPGHTDISINGHITGGEFKDYRVAVHAGQSLRVDIRPSAGTPYFNVMEPGADPVAIFVGSTSGNNFAARARVGGDYVIRVYQMRAAERRNATARYRIQIRSGRI